jgi:hypothetical protein
MANHDAGSVTTPGENEGEKDTGDDVADDVPTAKVTVMADALNSTIARR